MSATIEFIFDFASPNAYLVYRALPPILERSGARLAFDNLPDGGAHVAISWNRANLETVDQPHPPAAAVHVQR